MAPNEPKHFMFAVRKEPAELQTEWEYERSPYRLTPCPKPPFLTGYLVILCHSVLILMGLLAEWLRIRHLMGKIRIRERVEQIDFAPLGNHFEALFTNNIYRMASDVLNRPICSVPGAVVTVKERFSNDHGWTYQMSGVERTVINMGSYNYLGFSHCSGPCSEAAAKYIDSDGLGFCAPMFEIGISPLQRRLEMELADFLGVEDSLCFPMGFGTNTMSIPALANEKTLILSDELNHSSLILGMRISKGIIKVFPHNDMKTLEKIIIENLSNRSKGIGPEFNKILIIVEGIYSMEGTIVNMPELLKIKKKYKAYVFVDEAHSIGALGASGRGVVEYWGSNPKDVDILMGTLTKSFAGAGGYIAGTASLISYLRKMSASTMYAPSMSPPIAAQVITSLQIMKTKYGRQRNAQLLRNTRYFRRRLEQMGFIVYGHEDSAVIPVLGFYMPKVVLFGRETLKRGVAVVSVGFPAVSLHRARARFCVSADHTKAQLDEALRIADEVGDLAGMKYGAVQERSVIY